MRPSEQTASTRAGLGGRRRPPRGRTMKGQRPVGRPGASEGGAPFTGRRTSLESGRLCLGVLAMLLGGLACSSAPKGPAPVAPSQLLLRLASHTELTVAKMPNQVYLFPPLLCDAEGKPEQSYLQAVREDGTVDWLPPDEKSREWWGLLRSLFAEKGFEIVPYSAVLQSHRPHSILVVSAYYSRPYRIGGDGQAAYSLFTRLAGDTYPVDLDPKLRRSAFNQIATGFFLARSKADAVPPLAYRSAISAIGYNGLRKVRLPLR